MHDIYDEDLENSDDDYVPDDEEEKDKRVTVYRAGQETHSCSYCKKVLASVDELALHLGTSSMQFFLVVDKFYI